MAWFFFLLILHARLCTFALLPGDICGALEMPLLLSLILVIILLLLLFQTHGVLQRIDRRLITKIDELFGEGVRSVSEMQNHLLQYLKSDVFRGQALPPKSNRQYFPSEKTVRNHMYLARQREIFSKCDLVGLQRKVAEWRRLNPGDNFLLRLPGFITKDPEEKHHSDDDIVQRPSCMSIRLAGRDDCSNGMDRLSCLMPPTAQRSMLYHCSSW